MAYWLLPEAQELEWWPSHVRRAFANLGEVLGPSQLQPALLDRVSSTGLPDHEIVFGHLSNVRGRKGMYTLEIIGPLYAGKWTFPSGFLEKIARAAAA
jgi:hypothetical protein